MAKTQTEPTTEETKSELSEIETLAETTEQKRWVESHKIPSPFRPSHLSALLSMYAKDNNLDASKIKQHEFLKEQALPNPVILYRVSAFKSGAKECICEPAEINAVDSAEAIRIYREEMEENKGNPALKNVNARFETIIIRA